MWPNQQETADLITFTEESFDEKLHFLCSGCDNCYKTHLNPYGDSYRHIK